jgi:uncharacterized membrane protein YobD (UPF0266 family)
MNSLKKNLGIFVLLIGVLVLIYAYYQGVSASYDTTLLAGLGLIIVGYLGHIFLNKKYE